MYFFHTYDLEKYCMDKLTISYLFSVHFHKHHANLGKHGQNGRGKVNRYSSTHRLWIYTMSRAYVDLLQWIVFNS